MTGINATMAIWENFREAMDNMAGWVHRFETHQDTLIQARTSNDILQAKEQGKVGVVLGWQNSSADRERPSTVLRCSTPWA